jgi:hypothetical protein
LMDQVFVQVPGTPEKSLPSVIYMAGNRLPP